MSHMVSYVMWWVVVIVQGEWKGASAGGCTNFDSVSQNPQFLLRVSDTPTNVVISLGTRQLPDSYQTATRAPEHSSTAAQRAAQWVLA